VASVHHHDAVACEQAVDDEAHVEIRRVLADGRPDLLNDLLSRALAGTRTPPA